MDIYLSNSKGTEDEFFGWENQCNVKFLNVLTINFSFDAHICTYVKYYQNFHL